MEAWKSPQEWLLRFAPIASENERTQWLMQQLGQAGYPAQQDELGNVWVGQGGLWLIAHIDTVLTPQPIRVQDQRWLCPAIGDNSSGVAVLLAALPKALDLGATVAFSVGEEGLGNLRGARALVQRHQPKAVVAIDGYLPGLVVQAVGSVRLRARFTGPGGHAWGDRGRKSPMPALGQALGQMYSLARPNDTSLNVGKVWGGHAINAIPQEAGLELDLRATDSQILSQLEEEVRQLLLAAAGNHGAGLELEVLGRRPAGQTATPAMQEAAKQALVQLGLMPQITPGSTDAAAAVEAGIPAITLGAYRGGGAHTPEEWVEPDSLTVGYQALLGLVQRLVQP